VEREAEEPALVAAGDERADVEKRACLQHAVPQEPDSPVPLRDEQSSASVAGVDDVGRPRKTGRHARERKRLRGRGVDREHREEEEHREGSLHRRLLRRPSPRPDAAARLFSA